VAPLPPALHYIPNSKRYKIPPVFMDLFIVSVANLYFAVFMCFRVDSMGDFKVEIDVQSYLTIVDGKRVYTRGKTWDFMVNRDLSVARIKEVVEKKFKWSHAHEITPPY
jgi:hypothetical protein